MNDFIIQGVTILGTETEKALGLVGLCFYLVIFFLLVVLSACLWLLFLKDKAIVISLLCLVLMSLSIYAAIVCIRTYKEPPSMVYTVSIDDTASYNEIKNNFYSVKELPNGLYEVTLKQKK